MNRTQNLIVQNKEFNREFGGHLQNVFETEMNQKIHTKAIHVYQSLLDA